MSRMKIMDTDEQDDCCIEAVTPIKKKKMKQAQLPFQTRSPIESSNTLRSKKRKLTSPSVDHRNPKIVKISEKNVNESVTDFKSHDSTNSVVNTSNDSIEIIENTENEKIKENETLNKAECENKKALKRTSMGQKKLETKDKIKSSPLTKFLKKNDKEADSLKEDCQNSLQSEKIESSDNSCDRTTDKNASESEYNPNNKLEGTVTRTDNSLYYNSDSDAVNQLSDNDDKEEQEKPNSDVEKSMQLDSSRICTTPKQEKVKQRKLTPKQQEKRLESAKKKKEKQKLKMEKEIKMEEERQIRRREKEEKRKEKEEKEKAEKEQKLKEKKMKELKKQMEIEQKQKEKQAKEEERRKKEEAREEEKRKKEEERLEMERKKQKAASNFTSFFVAKKLEKSIEEENTTELKNFMPFEVKVDMKIAPVSRRILSEEEKLLLDEKCNKGDTKLSKLYLGNMKNANIVPNKSYKTWPLETKDDVIILDDENDGSSNIVKQNIVIEKQRTKLLQFSENRRPPYWGTWRKRSSTVNSRRPFAKDTKWFNYEIDSDDEWEEEEPGESLRGSDDEKDEENPDDNEYDVDNEFMVPHGYLSDEEVRADEEDKEDMSPESQKFKLQILGEQFDMERNTKTSKLKPKIIGCIWRGPENAFTENVPQRTVEFLSAREAWVRQIPVALPTALENETVPATECGTPTQQLARSKKTRLPEEALPDLVRLVHGNVYGRKFLVKEFSNYWNKNKIGQSQISNNSLANKIREIGNWMACPEEGPMHLKACWYVSEEIRKRYVEEDLSLPNRWSYTLVPKRKSDCLELVKKLEKEDKEKERRSVPLITQFTKKITQEEMKRQLSVKSDQNALPRTSKAAHAKTPKRATLISVARGEQFSNASKENLLSSFVNNDKFVKKDSEKRNDQRVEDVVVLCDEDDEDKPSGEGKANKKDDEDRLASASVGCDQNTEEKKKKKKKKKKNESLINKEKDKSNPKSQCDGLDEDAKETLDDSAVIDVDDSSSEN